MKNFIESQKPIHPLLASSGKIRKEDPPILRKDISASLQALETNSIQLKEKTIQTIRIGEERRYSPPTGALKDNKVSAILKIWIQFWGRSALYLCVISFIVGASLSIAYFYKIEINLDKLLNVYIGCSFALWFFLTPIALYRSLRKIIKN